ncbi:MAG: glycosyltransferase [Bacteroidetes bacterium]|nr:glycosyltransferase [Bacteroidota bacterium]
MTTIELIAIIVLVLLANCFIIQWLYHLLMFSKLALYKPYKGKPLDNNQPVSVIIAARNEYLNLEKHLPSILEQDYPNYEVIVVNDCSWDQTAVLLERLQSQYPHLHIVTIHEQEKYPTGKKFAVTLGIKAAQNELLVFTDADCKPQSRKWLSLMASNFSHQKQIVLGYSPYSKQSGVLNMFIRFETMLTAMFYFSYALIKDAYMGVGRNLAYKRSLFFSVKGFASHNHIISGDDDLFVNETSTPSNVAIELRKDSFMTSEP